LALLATPAADNNGGMKKYLCVSALLGLLALAATTNAFGQSFADLQGKWTMKKASSRFGDATQTVEFKDQKFTYKVVSKEGDTILFAKGKAKVEKLGPFNVVKLTDIQGGGTEADVLPIDDDRTIAYMTGAGTLTVALNFDRKRDNDEPECSTFTKVKE
jgi:hypothetical protein